jgi:death-on-curing protein
MKQRPAFLTVAQVLAIHRRVMQDFGGDSTVRDEGLLQSAVMMPAAQYGGKLLHPDIEAMAAAYLFHICRNHAFADGNKRTALVAAELFLLLNGWQLKATNRELERLTLWVAAGEVTKHDVIAFFREHVTKAGD